MMFNGRRQNEVQAIEIGIQEKSKKKGFLLIVCVLVVTSVILVSNLMNQEKTVNFDDYKTVVGDTAENSLGKVTLNEVMVDDNQLLLNATFEPVNDIHFDHQIFFFPQVHVNGLDYTVRNRGQTIVKHKSKYTLYSSIQVSELPKEDILTLDISYNKWNLEKKIDQPWNFHVKASQKQLQEDKIIFSINTTLSLNNSNEITIKKVVSTPISTTVYYDAAENTSEIAFKITSASGKSWRWHSGFTVEDVKNFVAVNRFDALYLMDDTYYLIPIAVADDKALGPPIQINKREK